MKKQNLLQVTILILSMFIMNSFVKGQTPHIHRQKCIGGTKDEYILYMIKLSDGSFLSCGTTNSHDGDFATTASFGGYDAFLMKTDNAGNIIWVKTYGGSRDDIFYNLIETPTA